LFMRMVLSGRKNLERSPRSGEYADQNLIGE